MSDRISNADLIAAIPDPQEPWERIEAPQIQPGDQVLLPGDSIGRIISVGYLYTAGVYEVTTEIKTASWIKKISFGCSDLIFVLRP